MTNSKLLYCVKCGCKSFHRQGNLLSCHTCGFKYYKNVAAAAVGLIVVKNEVLLIVRANEPYKGYLHLPGGFVDPSETGEDALSRELMEEIGIKVNHMSFLYTIPNDFIFNEVHYHILDIYFLIELDEKPKITCSSDAEDFVWEQLDQIDYSRVGYRSVKLALKRLQDHYS